MRHSLRIPVVAGALLLLPLLGFATAQAQDEQFEIEFLQNMIDHHHMAVMMSELCDGRVVHEELGQLCEQIMMVQTAEIELMQTWLLQWYGIEHEPVMDPEMMELIEQLTDLTGEEFEIAYMQMMIDHHQMAIEEAGMCLENAVHEELIALCESIRESQENEIDQMTTWLCEWYDICEPTPTMPRSWGSIKSLYR